MKHTWEPLVNVFINAVSQHNTLKIVVANRLPGQNWEFQRVYPCKFWGQLLFKDPPTVDNGVCKASSKNINMVWLRKGWMHGPRFRIPHLLYINVIEYLIIMWAWHKTRYLKSIIQKCAPCVLTEPCSYVRRLLRISDGRRGRQLG